MKDLEYAHITQKQKVESRLALQRETYQQQCLEKIREEVSKQLSILYNKELEQQAELERMIVKMKERSGNEEKKQKLVDEQRRREELLKPENSEAFKLWQIEMYEKEFFLRKKAGIVYLSTLKEIHDSGHGRTPEITGDIEMQVMNDIEMTFNLSSSGEALRYGSPNWEHTKFRFQRPSVINGLGSVYSGNVFFFVTPNGAEGFKRDGFVSFSEWLDIIEKKFKENALDFRRENNMY
ncbi:MAG: hypothetical protein NTZ87_00855 [Candidatus Nomurabacteria bacterium]|nr:hypothetical protein [Candidatus Nomurabacteria bacterium]